MIDLAEFIDDYAACGERFTNYEVACAYLEALGEDAYASIPGADAEAKAQHLLPQLPYYTGRS
jgi:hypothetical protein